MTDVTKARVKRVFVTPEEALVAINGDRLATVYYRTAAGTSTGSGVLVFVVTSTGAGTFSLKDWREASAPAKSQEVRA